MKTLFRSHIIPSIRLMACMLLFTLAYQATAAVKLPRLIGDGMILQRDIPAKIWGWASPKEKVVVTLLGKSYQTKADKNGDWQIALPAQAAGGPHSIQINDIRISDVLFGDVWLCSGQSNMELPIKRTLDLYKDEVEQTNNPMIRQFRVPMKYNFESEEKDLQSGLWVKATADKLPEFSAAAYFFAKDLYDTYHVPIGIINTAIGGSPAEAWISEDGLARYPHYIADVNTLRDHTYIDKIRQTEAQASKQWHDELNIKDKGIGIWNKKDFDDTDWSTFSLPGYWADKGINAINGSFWFRKTVEIPSSLATRQASLRLGCIVDADSVFVNGRFVGTTSYQYPPRIYNIPEGVLNSGSNNITIRVVSYGGRGGFVEEKPYKIIVGDSQIDISGDWKYHVGAEMPQGASQTFFQYKPAGLYNGMIAPLKQYTIKGFLWYQGESNTGKPKEYKSLFTDLIYNWRDKWGDTQLPFVYAQLPNFMKSNKKPAESNWAELREAQRQVSHLPNTGMAVTIDLGEWNDIHPLNKKSVGQRLALQAKRIAYNDSSTVSSGPVYQAMQVAGNSIILSFSPIGSGIYSNIDLDGFAIAGDDKKYVWAKATILSKDKIRVWSDQITQPVSVRYAWADNPAGANLMNKERLPASPFTTDTEL